jgi:hypothetical protein
VTHEQGVGQKEGQQEETGKDIAGEARGQKGKEGGETISSVMAALAGEVMAPPQSRHKHPPAAAASAAKTRAACCRIL